MQDLLTCILLMVDDYNCCIELCTYHTYCLWLMLAGRVGNYVLDLRCIASLSDDVAKPYMYC